MNREAAALGVPVYSVFRGNIGAVDRYLSGRLVLLESVQDVQTKIRVKRRSRPDKPQTDEGATLSRIVEQIVTIVKQKRPLLRNEIGDVSPSIDSVGVSEEKESDEGRHC